MNTPYIPFRQFQEVEPGIRIAFALNWGGDTQYPMATSLADIKTKYGENALHAKFWADFEDCEVGSGLLILTNYTEERIKSDHPCDTIYRIDFWHDGDPELECWGWRYEKLQSIDTSYELTETDGSLTKPPTLLDHFLSGGK